MDRLDPLTGPAGRDAYDLADAVGDFFPPTDRAIWRHRLLDGLSFARIAAMLGLTEGEVRARWERRREQVREALRRTDEGIAGA